MRVDSLPYLQTIKSMEEVAKAIGPRIELKTSQDNKGMNNHFERTSEYKEISKKKLEFDSRPHPSHISRYKSQIPRQSSSKSQERHQASKSRDNPTLTLRPNQSQVPIMQKNAKQRERDGELRFAKRHSRHSSRHALFRAQATYFVLTVQPQSLVSSRQLSSLVREAET